MKIIIQKAYILIDEYDTPINSSYLEFGQELKEFDKVLKLFRGIFGSSLKGNPYLEKGVITGILRIAKANLFSDLNNVREYTLLDQKFSKSYGFTQEEVDELWEKLSEGGEQDQCGWLRDRFGVSWQIIPSVLGKLLSDPDPKKAQRTMNAMLQMRKIDIAALQQAAE